MTRPRVGVILPTRERGLAGDWAVRPLVDFARRAERLGFDSVWTGDSLTARPRLEPLTLLAAVAASTDQVTVGTAAMLPLTRQPIVTAQAIATLDQAAEGRLVLGLGAGFPSPDTVAELRIAGMPVTGRVDRLAATVEQWRELWRGDSLTGFPRPTSPDGPPLWFAGAGPRGLALAAEQLDGWLPYLPEAGAYAAARATLPRREDFTAALYVTVLMDDDIERATKSLDAYVQAYYGAPLEVMTTLQAFVAGSAAECRARLQAYAAAGATHFVVRIGSLAAPDLLEETADFLLTPW